MMNDPFRPKRPMNNEKGALSGFPLIVLTLFLTAAALALLYRWFFGGPSANLKSVPTPGTTPVVTVAAQGPDELWNALEAKLQGLDLLKLRLQAPSTRQVSVDGQDRSAHWERLRLPNLYTPQRLGEILAEVAAPLGARLVRPPVPMEEPEVGTIFPCLYAAPKGEVVRIDWVVTSKPRICLIIDDGGYKRGEALEHLYGFRVPVTVSIIPHTQFSHELAQEFPEHGVEVMCHLPMQGHEKVKPGDYREYLKRGMNTERAKEELGAALADLPNCRGLNNHMGSIATTDLRLMKTVCQGLKDRGMFVIDSRTTARAVVTKAAKTVHVPVAQRQTFLDNVERSSLILKQLRIAAAYAKKHGQVVAIGHFKVITLKTLETAVHDLEKEGYQFVYASEVVKP